MCLDLSNGYCIIRRKVAIGRYRVLKGGCDEYQSAGIKYYQYDVRGTSIIKYTIERTAQFKRDFRLSIKQGMDLGKLSVIFGFVIGTFGVA